MTVYEEMEPENRTPKRQQLFDENKNRTTITNYRLKELKVYYEEYCITAQQELFPPVDFVTFIIKYAEIGFMTWRGRHKGK